jgi:cobalt-zinc-cadmium efflux system outer membrane protein
MPKRSPSARTSTGLINYAKMRNPEYAAMQAEADASGERVTPAGALPDPKFRAELRDITRFGEQNATLSPSRVGSTRYLLMQDIPWFGKRDLKREIAELEADGAKGRALGAWADVAGRIKVNFAQLYYVHRNEQLTREILDLMVRLEKVAQVRYSGGLAAQQDVIRAQVEQTNMRNELIALETEQHHLHARLNALLSRPNNAPLQVPAQLRKLPAPVTLDFATLEERVRARNPQLFADESKIKAAEKSRDLTYKNRYPDFTLGVSPIQYQNSIKEWELMVELNIPLQQSSRRAQERESESMLNAARSRKEATANQVSAELAEALSGIEAARRTENLLTTVCSRRPN